MPTKVRPSRPRPSGVLALAVGALVAGSLLPVTDAAALDPPPEHTIVSRAILPDPLDIAVPGPSGFEIAQLTVEPGGTTGVRRYGGPALVGILGGTASRYRAGDGSCGATTVLPGVAYFVPPGQVEEIRNQGPVPLRLQTTSLAPAGAAWASPAPAPSGCAPATAEGLTVAVLSHTTIPGPVRIKTDGPSDILTGQVVVPPGSSAATWHSHPSATLVSVDRGPFHLVAAEEGRCVRREFPGGTAFLETIGEVHDGRNDGAATATIHYVGISSSGGPFIIPQPPRPECTPR